jgi:hypothetical protein
VRLIVREALFPAGESMDRDDQLRQATQDAIAALPRINRSLWPEWSDNVAIFTLCRHLATVNHDCDADELEPYVLAFWGATHEPTDWDEAWEQFLDLWDHTKVRIPLGNLADHASARAKHTQDPEWAYDYRPPLRFLIRTCIELARMLQNNDTFSLSQHDAARILGCSQQTAGRMLHRLCRDGVLMVKDRPPKGTLKAIKYKLLIGYPD